MSILKVFKKKKEEEKKPKEEKEVSVKARKKQQKDKKDKQVKQKKQVARVDSSAYRILSKPIISEKATFLGGENKYVFEISKSSNKKEVARAISDVYGIKPLKVHIVNVKGKYRKYGRQTGRTKDRKKAIVTLKEGQTIQVYEGV